MSIDAGTVVAYLDMDTSKYSSALKTAGMQLGVLESQSASLGDKLTGLGSSLKTVGATMAVGFTVPILAAGAAGIKLASDFNESLNKVNEVFDESASEVEAWSQKTLEASGIAQGTALDMSALFGDMAVSMGLPTDKAADMSMSLVGLAGDMASFKNISLDRAQTALAGVYTGETEALKGLGIVMNQSNLEAFALAQGIQKPIKEMTQGELVALRYAYVMDVTKNAHGDFARTSDGTANQMRIFQESLKELGASFGQHLLPVFTPIVQKLNETLKWFGELDEGTKKTIVTIAGIVAAIGPVLMILGALSSAIGSIIGLFTVAAPATTAVGAAATAAVAPIAAVGTAIGSVITFAASVLAPLAAVGAALYLLYQNSETFRDGVANVWERVKNSVHVSVDFIKTVFTAGMQSIKDIFNVFKAAFSGDWGTLWSAVKTLVSNGWGNLKSVFKAGWESIKAAFNLGTEVLKTVFANLWEGIKRIFSTALDGLKILISDKVPQWKEAIASKLTEIKASISQKLDEWKTAIASWFAGIPATIKSKMAEWGTAIASWTKSQNEENKRQFAKWGKTITDWFKGIPKEMADKFSDWKKAVSDGYTKMKEAGKDKFDEMKKTFLTDLSSVPSKITESLKGWGNSFINFFKGLGSKQEIKDSGKNMIQTATKGTEEQKQAFMDNLGKIIVNGFKYALAFAGVAIIATGREIIKQLVSAIKGGVPQMLQAGKDIVQGIIDGIQNKISAVKGKVSELAESIPAWLKKVLNIQSPSKVTTEIGQFVGEGLVLGMDYTKAAVSGKSEELASKIGEALSKVNGYVQSTVSIIQKQYELWRIQNKSLEGSSEDLAKQMEVQEQQHKALSIEIANTEKALSQIIAKYGETSSEALNYKNQLLDLQIEQAKLQGEIDKTSGSLGSLANAYKYVGQVMSDGSIYQGKNSLGQEIYKSGGGGGGGGSNKPATGSAEDKAEKEARRARDKANGMPDGYASGTLSATPGWHLVGEEGPELMWFNGGEKVASNSETNSIFDMVANLARSIQFAPQAVEQKITNTFNLDYGKLAQAISKASKPSVTMQNTFNSPEALDAVKIRMEQEKLTRSLAMQWGV